MTIVDTPFGAEEVADRLAIQHVIARYVHALDAHDFDSLDGVFAADAVFDLTTAGGPTGVWGDGIREWFTGVHATAFVKDFHLFSNTKIDFDSPERATATTRTKVLNPRTILDESGTPEFSVAVGVYTDQWRRDPEGWRIVQRTWARAFLFDR